MTTGKTLHLSRLSRGVGEEYPKYSNVGHHKINVYLEPQDYFNWIEKSKNAFQLSSYPNLPKLKSVSENILVGSNINSDSIPVVNKEIILPKTFTTRRGALLLFSEDLANKNRTWGNVPVDENEKDNHGEHVFRNECQEKKHEGELSVIDLRTVGEFAKSILAYGNQPRKQNYIQLLTKIDSLKRQFRPGFSAKRYLSMWSKFWDHSTLDKLLKEGYIQSKSLFEMTHLSSFNTRSLDDLSTQPLPYRLVHTMLQTNLRGYTFLRIINNKLSTEDNMIGDNAYGELKIFDPGPSNQENDSKEIFYNQLGRYQQEQILTDYLLQSTVHHAFKVQQLQSLWDAKNNQAMISLPKLPLHEGHPGSNPEFGIKTKRRKMLQGQYRKLDRGKNVFLPPLEATTSFASSPPPSPKKSRKDPETRTILPTIIQKQDPPGKNPNPKICRIRMFPSCETSKNGVLEAPPTSLVDTDEVYDDNLWTSLVCDRISPAPVYCENKISTEQSSKNKHHMETDNRYIVKSIEGPFLSALNPNQITNNNSKMLKTTSQTTSLNKLNNNHRKQAIRKAFVNVPGIKGSIIQAPGGEIVHVGGSLSHRKTVLPDIVSTTKDPKTMQDEPKHQLKETQKWQAPLPDIGSRVPASLIEKEEEPRDSPDLRTLSKRRGEEKSSLSLLSAPKVVEIFTQNAQRMASFILDQDGSGKDIDADIKLITRELSLVLSNENGNCIGNENEIRMLKDEEVNIQVQDESRIELLNKKIADSYLSSKISGEYKDEKVRVTETDLLKESDSPSASAITSQNEVNGVALADRSDSKKTDDEVVETESSMVPRPNQSNEVFSSVGDMKGTALKSTFPPGLEASKTQKKSDPNESITEIGFKSERKKGKEFEDATLANRIMAKSPLHCSNSSSLHSPSIKNSAGFHETSANHGFGSEEVGKRTMDSVTDSSRTTGVGATRNIIIKIPEVIETEDQGTSIEEADTASIEEQNQSSTESAETNVDKTNQIHQESEASDKDQLIPPRPDFGSSDRRPPLASNTDKRLTLGRSISQNSTNSNLLLKAKRGKSTTKEEFKVSRVDYTDELRRLYSRTESSKDKTLDTKQNKTKNKEKKTTKVKSKAIKKQKLSKKTSKTKKMSDKSPDEPKPESQWKSEDQTSTTEMVGTTTENVDNLNRSLTDQNMNNEGRETVLTWVQDESKKAISDGSDAKKGDNSVSPESVVSEQRNEVSDDDDGDEDGGGSDEKENEEEEGNDTVTGEADESALEEKEKKIIQELKRILTPRNENKEIEKMSKTKSPEATAVYDKISTLEARAAERRARAAKRREMVERKRKEREEQMRKAKEMAERQEKLRQELEEQRQLMEEERRLKKQEEEEERRRIEEEELAKEVKRLQEIEAEKRKKEEHMRKLRQLKMQQLEEERRRQELLKRQKEEEEERLKAEEEMLAQMAEQERIEYEKKKREDEERRIYEEEQKRIRQEEEARKMMEEAIRLAQENAKQKAELEARFQFTQTLSAEAVGLNRCQAVTRAFVFSYFELLNLLGIENTDQQQQQTVTGDIT